MNELQRLEEIGPELADLEAQVLALQKVRDRVAQEKLALIVGDNYPNW